MLDPFMPSKPSSDEEVVADTASLEEPVDETISDEVVDAPV